MDAKELAAKLHGREYREEMTEEEIGQAKEAGLVVVYGASDDLIEFRGAIYDEFVCFRGGTAYLNEHGLIQNECPEEDCPYFRHLIQQTVEITAVWAEGETSWTYKTDIPHETFDIMEEGKVYCRGLVFSLQNLEEAVKQIREKREAERMTPQGGWNRR